VAKYSKEKVIEQIARIRCRLFEIQNNENKAAVLSSWQMNRLYTAESILREVIEN